MLRPASSSATASPSGTCAAATSSPRPTATSSTIDPDVWFLEDEGYELAVFHSHPETEPVPSRTDRELAGLWSGRPFLIYGLARDELRAWRIARDDVEEIALG